MNWLLVPEVADIAAVVAQWRPGDTVFCNRLDIVEALARSGVSRAQIRFCDFAIDTVETSAERPALVHVFLPKEKVQANYLIAQALCHVSEKGRVVLHGEKQTGIKTYARKWAERSGAAMTLEKHGRDYCAVLEGVDSGCVDCAVDIEAYEGLRTVPAGLPFCVSFYSKPGQFGWDKLDRGSLLLIAEVERARVDFHDCRVLDPGCGYGLLSLWAARQQPREIVATDVNAAALASCRANLHASGVPHNVLAANIADGVAGRFERVLCNPPFHQGQKTDYALGAAFVREITARLAPGGEAWVVVNAFVPLPSFAEAAGAECQRCAEGDGFRVYRLTQRR